MSRYIHAILNLYERRRGIMEKHEAYRETVRPDGGEVHA